MLVSEVMANPNNEGKACDAIVRLLEMRTGERRTDIRYPELDGRGPPVELRLSVGGQDYAIEHTQIEAFEDQIQTGEEFGRLINPVVKELSGRLPGPGIYYLYFPIDARVGAKGNELDKARSDLTEWVGEHARRLHAKNPEKPTRERNPRGFEDEYKARPPGFPYEVTLRREAHWSLSTQHDGVLLPGRYAPEEVEALRTVRLQTALDRKCPKLWRCKEDGARTVLVLEDNDISLSNYVIIGDALAGLLNERPNLPDEIYLVESAINRWHVRVMKYDEEYFPEEDLTVFDSAELVDITGRPARRG